MKFTVKSTGRFDTESIVEKLTDKALENQLQKARAKVESLRCAQHGTGVTVTMDGTGATRTLKVTGCCDATRKKALELIRQK
jgi:hypothetical protein